MKDNIVRHIKTTFILQFLMLFFLITPAHAFFPNSAYSLPISARFPEGSIIAEKDGAYVLSVRAPGEDIVGVLVEQPDFVYINENETAPTRPVVTNGIAYMRVSNENGQIKPEDKITNSKNPGVGVKATNDDLVIGIAQEATIANAESIQTISVQLLQEQEKMTNVADATPDDTTQNLLQASYKKLILEPENPYLFIFSLTVIILSMTFGFMMFGRVAINGITAMGRNPLAKKEITTSIVINTLLVIAFTIATIVTASLIFKW